MGYFYCKYWTRWLLALAETSGTYILKWQFSGTSLIRFSNLIVSHYCAFWCNYCAIPLDLPRQNKFISFHFNFISFHLIYAGGFYHLIMTVEGFQLLLWSDNRMGLWYSRTISPDVKLVGVNTCLISSYIPCDIIQLEAFSINTIEKEITFYRASWKQYVNTR